MSDYFNLFEDLLPLETVPVVGVRLLQYISADGHTRYKFDIAGDAMVSQVTSLLDYAKFDLMMKMFTNQNPDEGF